MFEQEVLTNNHGVNIKIQSHILPDEDMKKAGFTRHAKDRWYYCRGLNNDLTFNVTINVDNSDFNIEVLDEDFLQPYDYQEILRFNPNHKLALTVWQRVEVLMDKLQEAGILSGHTYGEYI